MDSRSAAIAAVVLLACSSGVSAYINPTTFSSIQPAKLTVNVSFIYDGITATTPPVCKNMTLYSSCLPQIQAADKNEGIHIDYAVMPGIMPNLSDHVQLKLCYSNVSSTNRLWRKFNDVIAKSNKCPFVIKAGLSPVSGNYTWKPINNTIPLATYYVRAFVLAANPGQPSSPNQVAYGDSVGYFQVNKINSRPTNLIIAVCIAAPIGPIILLSYFIGLTLKKNR